MIFVHPCHLDLIQKCPGASTLFGLIFAASLVQSDASHYLRQPKHLMIFLEAALPNACLVIRYIDWGIDARNVSK